MAASASVSISDAGVTLRRLLGERGIERYALFFPTGQGRFFPTGEEEVSGSVLTPDGRCFGFWTAQDEASARPMFRLWHDEEPDVRWAASAEYQRARAAVGLD